MVMLLKWLDMFSNVVAQFAFSLSIIVATLWAVNIVVWIGRSKLLLEFTWKEYLEFWTVEKEVKEHEWHLLQLHKRAFETVCANASGEPEHPTG